MSTTTTSLPLTDLAAAINAAHQAAVSSAKKAIEQARQAGELLTQAKDRLKHGEWLPWLAANCPDIATRTAQSHMQLAKGWRAIEAKYAEPAHLTIEGALHLLSRQPDISHNEQSATATPKADSPAEQAKRKLIDEWKCCVSLVANIGGRIHETGLELPDDITEPNFIAVGKALANLENAWQFYKFTLLSPEQKARLSEWQP